MVKESDRRPLTSVHDSHSELLAKLSEDLLRAGHPIRFRATGNSMLPTIRDGEFVTVRPIERADARRGEILLIRSGRGMTAHRLIRRCRARDCSGKLVLRGDATRMCDEPVDESALLGRLLWVEREGRVVGLAGSWQRLRFLAREAADFFLTSVGAAAIRCMGEASVPSAGGGAGFSSPTQ